MFQRIITLPEKRSFFLFGPRGVGKTTLLKNNFTTKETCYFDLLNYELEERLLRRPQEFSELINSLSEKIKWVIIDEVQKLPFLLDEVHLQIEKNKKRFFVLTGSSARKLKQGNANLLAGRAFTYNMAPLTITELGNSFDLDHALAYGTLPEIYSFDNDKDKVLYLRSYTKTYLQEEIQMEGFVRNLLAFRQFLPLAANEDGQILSWSNFSRDVGVDGKTIRTYFQILEDTLLGFLLPPYRGSIRKRQQNHPKFYLFDTGVKRALTNELNLPLSPQTTEYGRAFEHFFILEFIRLNDYLGLDYRFSYFATNNIEIDLVVERPGKPLLFVEFKSSDYVKDKEIKPLLSIVNDVKNSIGLCISKEPRKRKIGNVLICPWQEAFHKLGLIPTK